MTPERSKSDITIKDLLSYDFIEYLFSSNDIGIMLVTLDQQILDANDTFCKKTGYTRDELTRMTVSDITHPDDLTFTRQAFDRAAQSTFRQQFEKRYLTRDGNFFWGKLRSHSVQDDDGNDRYRIVMVEDITEEKLRERNLTALAAIIEACDDAVMRCDDQGYIEFWSKGAEQLYGYSPAEVMGRRASEVITPRGNPCLEDAYGNLMEGKSISEPHIIARHKNGDVIEVSIKIFPIRNKSGEITGFGSIHRDVSEFNQLQEQLRHSQRLEAAGLLAGGIAHDFNNILTVIQGSCNFIMEEMETGSPIAKHLELIDRSSERASRLTRQLLAFSRKQRGMPEVLDPNALLEDFATMLKRTLGDDINLDTAFSSTWFIREDPTQLEQMVLNLSLNARHAMPKGGAITLETRDVKIRGYDNLISPGKIRFSPDPIKPGNYVMLSVADTGVGMDRETLEHIFDPFYTTKAKGEGTGLGLSVVYGMVAQGGGSIRVITALNEGTEFQILFPRSQGVPEQQEARKREEQRAGRGRILVLEDNEDVRTLSATLLKSAGYTVTVAENPRQILENEVDGNVDLILSDVIMPGMSGPEFSEIWLDKHPNANFLFMSGFFDENNATEALNSHNLIQKPFKPAELLDRVSRALER